jgi:integrase
MPRPATGSSRWDPRRGCWVVRVTLTDGSRSKPILLVDREGRPTVQEHEVSRAKEAARGISAKYRLDGLVPDVVGDTVNEWSQRWLEEREARGLTTVGHDRSRLKGHVLPLLGTTPIASVTRAQIEDLVTDLDRKIDLPADHKEHLAWKTASNVWVLVTKMFGDAVNAKRRDLRAREDNPAKNVKGPERGEDKSKQYLYPSEFSRLVSCGEVPLPFRTLYACAVYTYARAGELEALTWADDVDLEHGSIHITKAVDRRTGKVGLTKSGDTRRIPIEPELMPLLRRLHKERPDGDRMVWLPDDEDRAVMLRQHLHTAGVKRPELFANDATHKNVTFHDLRATGITWAAVRGDDPLRIKSRAGHRGFATTEIYIREAENLTVGFGTPFPELPKDLRGGFGSSGFEPNDLPVNQWSKGGSNP